MRALDVKGGLRAGQSDGPEARISSMKGQMNMPSKSFSEALKAAESQVGIPCMADSYDNWDEAVRHQAESVWPAIRERVINDYASQMFVDMDLVTPASQLVYLRLCARFIDELMNYRGASFLAVGWSGEQVVGFLKDKGHRVFPGSEELPLALDVFLYFDHFLVEVAGSRFRFPFCLGIVCGGNRGCVTCRVGELPVVVLAAETLAGIGDRCVVEVERLIDTHLRYSSALGRMIEDELRVSEVRSADLRVAIDSVDEVLRGRLGESDRNDFEGADPEAAWRRIEEALRLRSMLGHLAFQVDEGMRPSARADIDGRDEDSQVGKVGAVAEDEEEHDWSDGPEDCPVCGYPGCCRKCICDLCGGGPYCHSEGCDGL